MHPLKKDMMANKKQNYHKECYFLLETIRSIIAILVAKLAKKASRFLGKGGGNIPGVVARKIDSSILKKLASQVKHIILITGTNGKTTASNLMGAILKKSGEPIVHNKEGNNLVSGVTACFIDAAKWTGKLKHRYQYAVIEVDEANVPLILKELTPRYVLVNNFFRDQLDRVGELDTIVNKIKNALEPVSTTLVLNGDDPFVMRIGLLKKPTIYFGISRAAYTFEQYSMSESRFCPVCGKDLQYSHVHYGQLGYFSCDCGFGRPGIDVLATKLYDDMTFFLGVEQYKLSIEGVYNIYNALGPIAIAKEIGVPYKKIRDGLLSYTSANGRMQTYFINDVACLLNLVKNPAGMDISLSEMLKDQEEKQVVFFLNDLAHDSQDISWIWDTDLERLANTSVTRVICSGTRALDMAVRMKYAGIEEERIIVLESKEEAIDKALEYQEKTYFFPTYTALEPVKKYLDKKKDPVEQKRKAVST